MEHLIPRVVSPTRASPVEEGGSGALPELPTGSTLASR